MAARHSSTISSARVAFPSLPRNLQAVYKRGQMLAHQDRVARLPVPPLQQTLTKYLTSVKVRGT